MKYIRTKNWIVKHPHPDAEVFTFRYDIVKQADTIEELCDCFVVIRPQPRGTNHYILHRFAFVKDHCLNGDEMVYGAIWTDEGLIYVTKMNDKGELKLL